MFPPSSIPLDRDPLPAVCSALAERRRHWSKPGSTSNPRRGGPCANPARTLERLLIRADAPRQPSLAAVAAQACDRAPSSQWWRGPGRPVRCRHVESGRLRSRLTGLARAARRCLMDVFDSSVRDAAVNGRRQCTAPARPLLERESRPRHRRRQSGPDLSFERPERGERLALVERRRTRPARPG